MADHAITELLTRWRGGEAAALDELMPLVYDELRRVADRCLRWENHAHTLQSTALANEAYLRLVKGANVDWESRAHFFGVASRLIRQILVDHARARGAEKRNIGIRVPLEDAADAASEVGVDVLGLDDALASLAQMDAEQGRIVELRFFGGLTIEECAVVTGVSPRTVKREWATARAWLYRELSRKWK
ncbi:MAG: sigma-70 family RNA polymerase sigma factor [Acidobacteria bacterium]|nr:sigma-70 family RNA polymerase sigma factor [Acidobacteriota bacterium]